jgi:phenylacetic acid degradation operon negative regulatory protein
MTEMNLGEPTLLRRHAAGTDSARSVLFTVLGELVLPTGGEAWTSAFIDVFARLGVEEKAARQALMRTAAEGWLSSERIGRRTVWHLTPAAERLLRDGTERIFGFTAVAGDWDGRWTIVIARTPETERAARHLIRTRLRWAGFGSVLPGVWVSPRSDRGAEVRQILDEAQLPDGYLFAAEHQGGSSLAAMVGNAWDLTELARGYDDFIATFSDMTPGTSSDPLVQVIELVHAWRRFPWIDPGLPAQFLPVPWSGTAAATLFGRRHDEWAGEAIREWKLAGRPSLRADNRGQRGPGAAGPVV